MSDIEYDKDLINKVLDEVVTYETLINNPPDIVFGMIAERLNCVCIDEDHSDYIYINQKGEVEDKNILGKIEKIAYKYGFVDRIRKCWDARNRQQR